MRTNLTSLERLEAQIRVLQEGTPQGAAWEAALVRWVNAGGHPDLVKGWGWKQWPGRTKAGLPRIERGVDLIAEDRAGRLVAIQAKFRNDPDSPVKTGEVQKFVGAYRKHFPRRMLISNASSRARGIKEAVGDGEAELVLRTDLAESLFDWVASKPLPRPKVTPLPFQKEAAAAIKKHLKDGGRAQIVMACGSGKTYTTLLAMEALGSKRVLVLAPTLLLVKQLRDEWMRERTNTWATLAVCSDIGTDEGDDSTQLSPGEIGSKVTTDPAEIASEITRFVKAKTPYVVFGTYASSARIATAQKKAGVPAFDLVVADEAHRIAGAVGKADKEERAQRVVLDEKGIRAERRLFATATPRVYGGDKKRDGEEVVLESMDDPTRFGEEVYKLTFQQAVDLKRLVPYKLLVTIVTDKEIAALIHDRKYVDVQGKQITADDLATAIAVRRAYKELGISRVISYHGNIKRARAFAQLVQEIKAPGKAPEAECVTGAMAVEDRKEALTRLAQAVGPYLITNARCLTEGIDVPALDAVAFADPRRSQVDIVQAVGRAMRTPRGKSTKTTGYIILPVFLSKKELKDPETAVEGSAFAPVLQVLRALKAHDPYRANFFAKFLVEEGNRPHKKGEGIDEILEVSIGKELDRALAKKLERAVELLTLEVVAGGFSHGLAHLAKYVAQYGDSLVPYDYLSGQFRLGGWVVKRRSLKHLLTHDQVTQLDALGMVWKVNDLRWSRGFSQLTLYFHKHGHSDVRDDYTQNGFKLGIWLRGRKKAKLEGTISAEQIRLLETLAVQWDSRAAHNDAMLNLYEAEVLRRGHPHILDKETIRGVNIGSWLGRMRLLYKRGTLDEKVVTRLNNIGMIWDVRNRNWEYGFTLLRGYREQFGHVNVPASLVYQDFRLGSWINKQRSDKNQGALTNNRIAALDDLGMVWNALDQEWEVAFEALCAFRQREGHIDVPTKWVERGIKINLWVGRQRDRYKKGSLSQERIRRLSDIGFDFDPFSNRWNNGIEALQKHFVVCGDQQMDRSHMEGTFPLGAWVADKRTKAKRGLLSEVRIMQLEALGVIIQRSSMNAQNS